MRLLEVLLRRAPSKARRTAVQSQSNATRGNDENGRRHQNKNHHKDDENLIGAERVVRWDGEKSGAFSAVIDVGSGKPCG